MELENIFCIIRYHIGRSCLFHSVENGKNQMKANKEVVYPVNNSGEIIRETRVFHFLPTKGFVDYSLGMIEDKVRWFRFSNVRQIFENGSWKTFEFLD